MLRVSSTIVSIHLSQYPCWSVANSPYKALRPALIPWALHRCCPHTRGSRPAGERSSFSWQFTVLLWFLERPENLVPVLKLHQNIFGLLSICQYEETVGLSQEFWRFAAGVSSAASLTCHIFHGRFLRHCTKLSSAACRFLALFWPLGHKFPATLCRGYGSASLCFLKDVRC